MTGHVGTFNWRVTEYATTAALLRITSLSTGASDVNKRPFTILAAPFDTQ
jgi:hypothetical protein